MKSTAIFIFFFSCLLLVASLPTGKKDLGMKLNKRNLDNKEIIMKCKGTFDKCLIDHDIEFKEGFFWNNRTSLKIEITDISSQDEKLRIGVSHLLQCFKEFKDCKKGNNTQEEPTFFESSPKRDPLYIAIPITIIYCLIFVTGVAGNVLTCIVIAKNKYMHTVTNYYLFSLAISDLLLLVFGLPPEIVQMWNRYPCLFGEVFCVLRGLAAETSANATILTITAFTVERYIAICHPFLAQTMSKLSRAVKIIVAIWLVALSFAIPQAIQFGVIGDPGHTFCTVKLIIIDHSFEISTFLFFVTPMTLITVLYALIGVKLRKSNMIKKDGEFFNKNYDNRRNSQIRRHQIPNQSSRRVLKMLVTVVVAFFICWAPFHTQRLLYIYGSSQDYTSERDIVKDIYQVVTYISGILYYVSTTINPILYQIMSLKFREEFKKIIHHLSCNA